jgi:hypothetical protein
VAFQFIHGWLLTVMYSTMKFPHMYILGSYNFIVCCFLTSVFLYVVSIISKTIIWKNGFKVLEFWKSDRMATRGVRITV